MTKKHRVIVYGSLMRGFWNNRLLQNDGATFIGPALFDGLIYPLGTIPGARLSDKAEAIGELWEVDDGVLASLDRLEGFYPHAVHDSLYDRVSVREKNTDSTAYVYVINRDMSARQPIPQHTATTPGCWRSYYEDTYVPTL